jgi:hypothetical protein
MGVECGVRDFELDTFVREFSQKTHKIETQYSDVHLNTPITFPTKG